MNSLSVVIPSYNSAATLGLCLKALASQLNRPGDEVIVVDSSSDANIDMLCREFSFVRWERRAERLFPGAARNIGSRLAEKEWTAFLDADIVVGEGWRRAIEQLPPNLVAAGGPIEPADPRSRWGLTRYWIEFGQFARRNLPQQSWNVPSCNMVWLQSAFRETGGFPEDFRSADDLLFNFHNMKLRRRKFTLVKELGVSHPADFSLEGTRLHLTSLGYWSGRARLKGVPPGFSRSVLALPLLYLYRCAKVWRRCLQGAGRKEVQSLASPIARGVTWWCTGFYRALHNSQDTCY